MRCIFALLITLKVLDQLQPIREKHSVSEASIALILAQPIIDLDKYKSFTNHPGTSGRYANFTVKREQSIKATLNLASQTLATSVNPGSEDVGFLIESFNDSQVDYIVNADKGQTNVISFHSKQYPGWQMFVDRFQNDFSILSEIHAGLYVKRIGVAYVDHFIWKGNSFPPLEEIFQQSDYVPKRFLDGKRECDVKFSIHSTSATGLDIVETMFINIQKLSAEQFLLTIAHNVIAILPTVREFTSNFINGECNVIAGDLHSYNKEFLLNCLQTEVCKKIGLIIE